MQVRRANPTSLDAIRDLLSTVDLPHRDLTPSHLEHFFVCRDEEETVVGVVGIELYGEQALLRSLAVRPTCRGEGIGTRLADVVEEHARQQGARVIYLLTTTASDYFQSRGYEVIDRDALPTAIQQTEEAAQLCPSNATCMQRHLSSSPEAIA